MTGADQIEREDRLTGLALVVWFSPPITLRGSELRTKDECPSSLETPHEADERGQGDQNRGRGIILRMTKKEKSNNSPPRKCRGAARGRGSNALLPRRLASWRGSAEE